MAISLLREPELNIDYDKDYYSSDLDCACLNGGFCVLDNDFCVCPPEFTGRRCELKIEVDNSNKCGHLLNGESEFLDCAKCTCNKRILTCQALTSPRCDYKKIISIYNLNISLESNDILKLKGEKLEKLLVLMKSTQAYVYESYIHEYKYEHNYGLIIKDVEAKTIEIDSALREKKLTIYKSSDELIGIYFNIEHNSLNGTFC
ncbi:cryptic -like [Brachionus plicatilis]|uniref:Cryptic-like n=1 Tax=Brachionus plicatilis TaxID=10195 RepID=A0A3M7R348_BRAPC|nr:cryptic -like [Brachionus plicatilis]